MLHKIAILLQKVSWPIRYKLGAAFTIILLTVIADGLICGILLFNINSAEEKQIRTTLYIQRQQTYALAYQGVLNVYTDAIFYTQSKILHNPYGSIIFKTLNDGLGADPDKADPAFEVQFAKAYGAIQDHLTSLQTAISTGDFAAAKQEWTTALDKFNSVTELLNREDKQLQQELVADKASITGTIVLSTITIVTLTLFSVLEVLGLLYVLSRVIVHPINQLKQGLKELAKGDFSQRVVILNNDEIGELAQNFEQAVISLQKVLNGVQISTNLSQAIEQLTIISDQQAQGSNGQVAALIEVRTAMEELGRTAGAIASSANQVATASNTTLDQIERVVEASNLSKQCSQQMISVAETMLTGMEQIGSQVQEFNQLMQELNTQAEDVSKIVSLFSSIANNIHLLALNAAIESAGAGEYGIRFQAVTREIKELTNRANRATVEAHEIVSRVQQSNKAALLKAAEGQNEVLTVVEANSSLRYNLHALEESVLSVENCIQDLLVLSNQTREQAEEIKAATYQQRVSSEQVISSTQNVENIAEQNSSSAVRISRTSTELVTLANQLNGVLGQIKLTA
jgi:methyl-accepting chemotaxis protein